MINTKIWKLCLSLAVISLPAIGQINNVSVAQSFPATIRNYQEEFILTKNTPILISVPHEVAIDIKDEQTIPAIAIVKENLYDRYGNHLVSQGAKVTINIKSSGDKVAKIYADSIIDGATIIPIQASSDEISSNQIKIEKNSDSLVRHSQVGTQLGGLVDTFVGNSDNYNNLETYNSFGNTSSANNSLGTYRALGGILGAIVGLASGGESQRIVKLEPAHVLALKLEEDVIINFPQGYSPKSPNNFVNSSYIPPNPQMNSQQNPSSNLSEFQITNTSGDYLERIERIN